jgi:hypothetical protein
VFAVTIYRATLRWRRIVSPHSKSEYPQIPEPNMTFIASPRTIIGVPGRWETRADIVTAIAGRSVGYLYVGSIMMHVETKSQLILEMSDHDDSLAKAFSVAGAGRFSPEEIASIGSHTFCLYLTGNAGSIDSAQKCMRAANALLNCGGLGVKVESAGTAHSVSGWRSLCAEGHIVSMLKAFVAYVGSRGRYYSCGMHNLGHPDCIVDANINPDAAATLMHAFLLYLLAEAPTLNSGETFSTDAAAPRYRIFFEDCTAFSADNPFHNPIGVWKLVPA